MYVHESNFAIVIAPEELGSVEVGSTENMNRVYFAFFMKKFSLPSSQAFFLCPNLREFTLLNNLQLTDSLRRDHWNNFFYLVVCVVVQAVNHHPGSWVDLSN